ncbi:MAG: NAD(P)H-dependent glycerol-3-phosphate dehydrogenase [Rhabdochlamydiaceae bacterium]
MKISYLGAGTWGFCLASLLASKGHEVILWSRNEELIKSLKAKREHPKLPRYFAEEKVSFTSCLRESLEGSDLIVESVTSKGFRPLLEQIKALIHLDRPLIITSKGIEQGSGLLLPEVFLDIFSEEKKHLVGCLSGPSHAEEVIQKLPSSLVCSAYDGETMNIVRDAFKTSLFRVYPNADITGVSFGGAMKNIVAIACGISDGLGFGDNTKAALMTRGLHEIKKLAMTKSCSAETLNGLSGLGDLCVTCLSKLSRNYMFGRLIAEGLTSQEAKEKIGMVVEGAYTVVSALELGQKHQVQTPITQAVYSIIYDDLNPHEAVRELLQRVTKEEHL